MDLVERAKRILLQPGQEWQVINTEASSTADLYRKSRTTGRAGGMKKREPLKAVGKPTAT